MWQIISLCCMEVYLGIFYFVSENIDLRNMEFRKQVALFNMVYPFLIIFVITEIHPRVIMLGQIVQPYWP